LAQEVLLLLLLLLFVLCCHFYNVILPQGACCCQWWCRGGDPAEAGNQVSAQHSMARHSTAWRSRWHSTAWHMAQGTTPQHTHHSMVLVEAGQSSGSFVDTDLFCCCWCWLVCCVVVLCCAVLCASRWGGPNDFFTSHMANGRRVVTDGKASTRHVIAGLAQALAGVW